MSFPGAVGARRIDVGHGHAADPAIFVPHVHDAGVGHVRDGQPREVAQDRLGVEGGQEQAPCVREEAEVARLGGRVERRRHAARAGL